MKLLKMKIFIISVVCLSAVLIAAFSAFFFVRAEESGAEESSPESAPPAGYYKISYGYKDLVTSAGDRPSDYVKGAAPPAAYVREGQSHTVAANGYTFRDYIFAGWEDGKNLYRPGEVIYNISSNITLTAKWDRGKSPGIVTYGILIYASGGGNEVLDTLPLGKTVKLKEGRWIDGEGRVFEGGGAYLLQHSAETLAAHTGGGELVSVGYNAAGGAGPVQSGFKIAKGSTFTVDGCYAVKEGFEFLCWNDAAGKAYFPGDSCAVTEELVFTAQWREKDVPAPDYCSVTLSAGQGGTVSPRGKTTVKKGDSFSFTVSAEGKNTLASVLCGGKELGTGGSYTVTITADTEIYAAFNIAAQPSETVSDDKSTPESPSDADDSAALPLSSADNTGNENAADDPDILIIITASVCLLGAVVAVGFVQKKTKKKSKKRRRGKR